MRENQLSNNIQLDPNNLTKCNLQQIKKYVYQENSKNRIIDRKPKKTGQKQENRTTPLKTGKTGKTVSVGTLPFLEVKNQPNQSCKLFKLFKPFKRNLKKLKNIFKKY